MQHINLYGQLDRYVEPPFSSRQIVWLLAAVVVVYLSVFAFYTLSSSGQQRELDQLRQRQQEVAQNLGVLKSKRDAALADNRLKDEVAELERRIAFLDRVQTELAEPTGAKQVDQGFSAYLAGLARQVESGLWLTEISVSHGGSELGLKGRTTDPAMLPNYLHQLGREAAFRGQQFRVFRMQLPEQGERILDFDVRSKEVDQP